MSTCGICDTLKDCETSWSKYGCPEDDRPLPPAANELTVLPLPDDTPVEKRHVRRCPSCGAFFGYLQWHDYSINGTEDEEELVRLPPGELAGFLAGHVRGFERARAGLDALRGRAGSLGDYLDRGHPEESDRREALEEMAACDQQVRKELPGFLAWIDFFRERCPEALERWIGVHVSVCESFLEEPPQKGEDAKTARHVAADTRDCWKGVLAGPSLLIRDPVEWLPDYPRRLNEALSALSEPLRPGT
jgi:hypothetical protein